MFEWTPGIPIMDNMTKIKDEDLDKENSEVDIIEDIVEEVIEK